MLSSLIQSHEKSKCNITKLLLKAWKKPISEEDIIKGLDAYQSKFHEWMDDENIDIVVGPAAPGSALLTKTSGILAFIQTTYSSIFNIANCPAGVVPFTRVTKDDVNLAAEVKTTPESLEEQLMNQQKTSEGLPLAVQVAGKPWAEDQVLRVMKELESAQHF